MKIKFWLRFSCDWIRIGWFSEFQFCRICSVGPHWIFLFVVCRNGLHGCVRIAKPLGNDLKFTWSGVRKSWMEAVKQAVDQLKPPERLVNPLERTTPTARTVFFSQPSVWLLRSSSSGLRSRWILGHFQVVSRRGRNREVRFCERRI